MPTSLKYPTTTNAVQKTLGSALLTGVTASVTLNSVTGIQNKAGVFVVDRVDANGVPTPSKREYITFTGVSGSTLTNLTRNADGGGSDQDHGVGAIVEFVSDVLQEQAIIDGLLTVITTAGALDTTKVVDLTTAQTLTNKTLTSPKINENVALTATATQLNALAGGTIPVKASAAENVAGTDDAKFVTALANVPAFNNSLYRQAIINGNFDIWQRGTTITNPAPGYTADRWHAYKGAYATGMSVSRQAVVSTELANSVYCARVQRTAADASSDLISFIYALETQDSLKLLGQKLTLSFYARKGANYSATSNILATEISTGTGTDQQYANFTGLASDSQNNTLGSSWTKFTHTTASVIATSKTQIGIRFKFTGTGTAGADDYVEIAQVQLCAGSVALPFMPKSFAQELADCQRYARPFPGVIMGQAYTTGAAFYSFSTGIEMRIKPTATSGTYTTSNAGGTDISGTLTVSSMVGNTIRFDMGSVTGSPLVAGDATLLKPPAGSMLESEL